MAFTNHLINNLKLFLGFILCSFSTISFACSFETLTNFHYYQRQGNQLLYINAEPENWPVSAERPISNIVSTLNGIDLDNLRRVGAENEIQNVWEDTTPETHTSHYFTDGQHIIYEGKIIQNAPGEPAVDAKTFVYPAQMEEVGFSFAFDQFSTYSNGKRTGDNPRGHPVHLHTLTTVPGSEDLYFLQSIVLIRDRNNIFSTGGEYLDRRDGLEQIATSMKEIDHCTHTFSVIHRTKDLILLDGKKIEADADSFQIIEWNPSYSSMLRYRDKNGEHQYPPPLKEDKKTEKTDPSGWGVSDARYCAYGAGDSTSLFVMSLHGGTRTAWFYCQPEPPLQQRLIPWIGGGTGLLAIGGLIVFIKRKKR